MAITDTSSVGSVGAAVVVLSLLSIDPFSFQITNDADVLLIQLLLLLLLFTKVIVVNVHRNAVAVFGEQVVVVGITILLNVN